MIFCVLKIVLKKTKSFLFYFFQINIFLLFSDHVDVLLSKIILKKYYFNTFINKKHFKNNHNHIFKQFLYMF